MFHKASPMYGIMKAFTGHPDYDQMGASLQKYLYTAIGKKKHSAVAANTSCVSRAAY